MISLYLAPSERERRLAGRNHSLWLIVFLKVGNLVQGTRQEGSIAGVGNGFLLDLFIPIHPSKYIPVSTSFNPSVG